MCLAVVQYFPLSGRVYYRDLLRQILWFQENINVKPDCHSTTQTDADTHTHTSRIDYCLIQLMHLTYTIKHQITLTFKTLKNLLKHFGGVAPTCFGLPIRPSSGGAYAVLCAVTRSDSADERSLIVCVVCGCMLMPSVM